MLHRSMAVSRVSIDLVIKAVIADDMNAAALSGLNGFRSLDESQPNKNTFQGDKVALANVPRQ